MPAPLILVVEDNPITRKMLRVALESEGYAVAEAGDARTALAALEREAPDVVVQDIVLPDMDGCDLVQRMRALPSGADVPILALSGFVSRLQETRTVQAGFTAILVKPIEPSRLIESIQTYLPRRHAPPDRPGGGRRLLIVDDDPVQLKLTRIFFSQLGFRVTTSSNGGEALELARANVPDAILSDVLMPGVDGFELSLAARRDPRLAHVPVVLVTSYYRQEADQALAQQAGASALILRTPDFRNVVPTLCDALKRGPPPRVAGPSHQVRLDHAKAVIRQLEHEIEANAGLARRCTIQAAQLTLLGAIADALVRDSDIHAALRDVLAACLDAAGIAKGALYLVEKGELTLQHAIGYEDADRERVASFFGNGLLLERIVADKLPVSIPSTALPAGVAAALLSEAGVRSAHVVPLVVAGNGAGALFLGSTISELADEDPVVFARAIGTQVVQSLTLMRKSAYKSEFLANMSHELRTPLNSLLILSRSLAENPAGNLTPVQVEAASVIHRGGQELLLLINDILDLSKVEAGKLDLLLEEVDPRAIARELHEELRPLAQQSELDFRLDVEQAAPEAIRTDAQRLRQILRNLLANAFKFTEWGSVTLRVGCEPDGRIAFAIADTGVGIPADKLEAIFEAFQQADGSITRRYGGTGLGLAIARKLATLLDGELRVASREGQGSTFTLLLPMRALETTAAPSPEPSVCPPPELALTPLPQPQAAREPDRVLSGRTVLLADDDMRDAYSLSRLLCDLGMQVVIVENGARVLDQLAGAGHVDLLLMDTMMPVLDGYETTRRIRADERYKSLPVIALTAKAMPEERARCLAAGANDYLAKPVDEGRLLAVLRARLSERS